MNKIIPANPGFCVLEPVLEDGKIVDAVEMPIVAWLIKDTKTGGYMGDPAYVNVPIILVDGDFPGWLAIKTDTGAVIDCNASDFESVAAWLATNPKEQGR